jgi:hypothetical protein
MDELLSIYRERNGNPAFWAEPFNAVSNVSFLLAAIAAWRLARQRGVADSATNGLVVLSATIGVGSFLFHTAASPVTMWLDIIPIAFFMVTFLWLVARRLLGWGAWLSMGFVGLVLCASFALLPIHEPFNGSLFYAPSFLAVLILGAIWSTRPSEEPPLLLFAAGVFAIAIVARTTDWRVPWSIGSHFIWHLLNGLVVYLGLRAWILRPKAPATNPHPL